MSCMLIRVQLQLGGIGFVHYNMSTEQQVQIIQRVKQQAAGYEANPLVISPSQSTEQLKELKVPLHTLCCRIIL